MDDSIEKSLEDLYEWCRQRDFAGYDPFDALNSRIFQTTPFSHSPTARLLWTQALKRSPYSLQTLARVPAQSGRQYKRSARKCWARPLESISAV